MLAEDLLPPARRGAHVYRSLAEFLETDTGRFNQGFAHLLAVAVAFARVGGDPLVGRPGEGLFLID